MADPPTASPPRPLRADAQRNRERVVRAAQEVFAEQGLDAGVPEIAARAGVGKGTVYRGFPTKEHLVAAVVCERLGRFEAEIRAALEDDDAWTAFRRVLVESAERQAADRALAGSFGLTAHVPELERARAAVTEQLDLLMARAKDEGTMRADATSADVRVLFAGMARVLVADGVDDAAVWRRCAGLVADAMRA